VQVMTLGTPAKKFRSIGCQTENSCIVDADCSNDEPALPELMIQKIVIGTWK